MNRDELLDQVYRCAHCDGCGLPFVRSGSGKVYRFPPTIGAVGSVPLLFVGINPRISASNRDFHNQLVDDFDRYKELSENRIDGGEYIGLDSSERHYALHLFVARALFPHDSFSSVAAVTELHFCASPSSAGLPPDSSRCIDRYFSSVLEVVSPTIVFALGKHVWRTLCYRRELQVKLDVESSLPLLVELPHPNAFGPKKEPTGTAIAKAQEFLRQRVNSPSAGPTSAKQ